MAETPPAPSPARVSLWFWVLLALLIGGAIGVNQLLFGSRPVTVPPGWLTIRPPRDVHAIVITGDTVWAGGKEGLWAIDRVSGAARHIPGPNGKPLPLVNALAVDPKTGVVWVGFERGLVTIPEGAPIVGPGDEFRVQALHYDRQGRLRVGGWFGLAVVGDDRRLAMMSPAGRLDPMVNVIFEDSRDGLWYGSYTAPRGGLSIVAGEAVRQFSVSNGLPHNNINAIVPVSDTEVWVATGFLDRGGVAVFTVGDAGATLTRTVTKADGLAGEKARSLGVTRDGTIWVGSEYDGLAYARNGRWSVITEMDGLCNNEIKTIAEDTEGNLWLGTRDGVMRFSAAALAALP